VKERTLAFSALIALALGLLAASAQAQTVIIPSAAAENGGSMGQGRTPEKAIDRSGLNDPGTRGVELDDTHDGVRANQWGATWDAGRTFTLTLPGTSSVDRVHLWNAVEVTARGVQSCDFSFSTDGGGVYANTTNLTFSRGGNTAQTRTFPPLAGVTHIQLSNFVTYDGNTYINIPEIRFGMPDPVGQMYWIDWRESNITTGSVQLTSQLGGTNADVSVYWEAGAVANPAAHTGWDGTNGPGAESTGAIVRTASDLAADTAYAYAFYATNQTHGTKAWSEPGSFITAFSDAQAPAFTSAVPGIVSVSLDWEDRAANETSYILQRSTNSSGPYTTIDVGTTTSYIDTPLDPGTRFYYRLAATNDNNGSATSFSLSQTNAATLELPGEVIAEYLFDGTYESTDLHEATTASPVSSNGHAPVIDAGYYEAESDAVGAYLSGDDYLTFTVTAGAGARISLTALEWYYGTGSAHLFESGIFSDAYEGFDASGDVIPGTYAYTHGENRDVTENRQVADLSLYPGFKDLTGTSVVFRIYMGDGATFGGRFHRYDTLRLYATDSSLPPGTVMVVR